MSTGCHNHNKMLNYTQTFDICEDLKILLSECNDVLDESTADITVLGQEKGGGILFSWLQTIPMTEQLGAHYITQEEMHVTNIGLYDTYNKKHKVLYTYASKVKLVSATVNEDHTFLGFVSKETVATTSSARRLRRQEVYKAFLAEISPQNRTFSLNLEKQQYIRLQFLYGAYQTHNAREAHLIVILHKESVGLYHLPIARIGEGVIMSQEPRKEQLFMHKFVWSQWDPSEQRLYIIYHKKETIVAPLLVAYQFSALGPKMATLMFEQELDLPIPRLPSTSAAYPILAPSQIVQDISMNTFVLVQNNGSLCVCCQHPGKSSMEYSVMLLHHGQTIHCTCTNLSDSAVTGRLLFSWLGGHICVQLAGSFVHLLNVDIEYEPGHHILWHDTSLFTDDAVHIHHSRSSGMINLLRDKQNIAAGCLILEGTRGYRVSLDTDLLASCFQESKDMTMRLAILHYAIVHNRDIGFMKQLCSTLCENESSMEMATYLREALVGLSYSRARRQIEQEDLRRCFPYTTVESMRGQTVKHRSTVLSQIKYIAVKNAYNVGKSPISGDLWQKLAGRKQQLNAPSPRFCTRSILFHAQTQSEVEKEAARSPTTEKPSLLKRLASHLGSNPDSPVADAPSVSIQPLRASSRTELGPLPDFLAYTDTPLPYQKQRLDVISMHMSKFIGAMSEPAKRKLDNVASEYLQCQMYASRLLCHILWGIVGDDETWSFPVLERFLLACLEQGFVWPQPFLPFLTQLAFSTLPLRTFLPYVDQKILQVTPDFVTNVMKELDDSPKNVLVKQQLLQRLAKDEAVSCLQAWSHPSAVRLSARLHATEVYTRSVGRMSPTTPPIMLGIPDPTYHSDIPPLQALCSFLKFHDMSADTDLVERAAFLDKKQGTEIVTS